MSLNIKYAKYKRGLTALDDTIFLPRTREAAHTAAMLLDSDWKTQGAGERAGREVRFISMNRFFWTVKWFSYYFFPLASRRGSIIFQLKVVYCNCIGQFVVAVIQFIKNKSQGTFRTFIQSSVHLTTFVLIQFSVHYNNRSEIWFPSTLRYIKYT